MRLGRSSEVSQRVQECESLLYLACRRKQVQRLGFHLRPVKRVAFFMLLCVRYYSRCKWAVLDSMSTSSFFFQSALGGATIFST